MGGSSRFFHLAVSFHTYLAIVGPIIKKLKSNFFNESDCILCGSYQGREEEDPQKLLDYLAKKEG